MKDTPKFKTKNSTIFYHEWLPLINSLSDEKRLYFYDFIFSKRTKRTHVQSVQHSEKYDEISDPHLKSILDFILPKIEDNEEKYLQEIEKRRVAGLKSGEARRTKRTHVQSVEHISTHLKSVQHNRTKRTDNDNDKDIINNKIINNSLSDFTLKIANGLKYIVEKNCKTNPIKPEQIQKWGREIRLLETIDLKSRKNAREDIERALAQIDPNFNNKYFPVIQSGDAFRSKFQKIESFIARNKQTSATSGNAKLQNQNYSDIDSRFLRSEEDGNED